VFSNEFNFDETITTILDDGDEYEDVRLIISDDSVFIQQWDDSRDKYEVICMSTKMFYEFQEALKKPEGMYFLKIKTVSNYNK
jgi:hypothetical protein